MLSVKAIHGCVLQNERANQQWGSPGTEKNRSNQGEKMKEFPAWW